MSEACSVSFAARQTQPTHCLCKNTSPRGWVNSLSVSFAARHKKNCNLQTDTRMEILLSFIALMLLSTIKCKLVDQYLTTEVYRPRTSGMKQI